MVNEMWSSVGEGKKFLSCRGDVVVDWLGGSAYSGSVNVLQPITCIGLHGVVSAGNSCGFACATSVKSFVCLESVLW